MTFYLYKRATCVSEPLLTGPQGGSLIMDTTESERSASYLDLFLNVDKKGNLCTKIYDKRDDFTFPIVNFPFLSSNIPASPAYGVYISQLIRYARACSTYDDFPSRSLLLTSKLLVQGYQQPRLKANLKKFYGRHNLIAPYDISVSQLVVDLLPRT